MSYAASLPAPQREPYLAAVTQAGRLLAEALADQAELARAAGARAAAEAAWRPGGPSVEEIEAAYLRLLETGREGATPAAGKAA